jgi:hypothetical protein
MLPASYQPLPMSETCKQLTQNNAKVCLENFLLPSFSLQANNERSKNHTCSLLKPRFHYPDFDVRHLCCVNHKLTVSVKTVINTTNYLLQLAMVGSYQQLHVSAFMEVVVRVYH